ncbi:MAG: CDGSH iron-sulfur domain-containing protein [Alphaproteobacteria bacterium]|jgi:CDGSH-type Zn-finger protein|nr:CDGSH iron-sulfur domain-containing protein [Alphaproteobacteria bacterium]
MAEPKPVVAQEAPMAVELQEGETVWWCACGRSADQPWCDGSHYGTGIEPVEWTAKASKTYYLCCCKQTKRGPVCDGSHNAL